MIPKTNLDDSSLSVKRTDANGNALSMHEIRLKQVVQNVSVSSEKELPLRNTPCHDCAVVTGFYKEHSDALRDFFSDGEKIKIAKKWHCHNNCNKACRGNADNCNLEW